MATPANQLKPLALLGGAAGAVGGWLLSSYCGANLLLPGLALILLLVIFAKSPVRPRYFVGAIAVTAAHLAWFVAGAAIIEGWSAALLDIVALTAGIVWLWVRPGLASALFLGVVQGLSLLVNAYQLLTAPFGSASHRALTVHVLFRVLALVFLAVGFVQFRRARLAPPPLPADAVA